MKPETQITVGKIAAVFLVLRHLLIGIVFHPIIFVMIEWAGYDVKMDSAIFWACLNCLVPLPLIAASLGFYWTLTQKEFKVAVVLFVVHVLWALFLMFLCLYGTIVLRAQIDWFSIIVVIDVVMLFPLLQGILGIRKAVQSPSEV